MISVVSTQSGMCIGYKGFKRPHFQNGRVGDIHIGQYSNVGT
jgi:hypothetical protein